MKIGSLVPYKILPPVKGGEKAIFFLLKYIARRAQVSCLSVEENAGDEEGILFKPVLGSTHQKLRYINPLLFFRVREICRRQDVQHLMMDHPYFAWLGFAIQKFAGIKWILRSHNIEAERFRSMNKWWWKLLFYYEKFAHCSADFSFFITEEDRQYAIGNYGVSADKCAVVTYGVEAATAPLAEDKLLCKKTVCEDLGLPLTTKLILFNGTLDYAPNRDGLDRILNAINPLLQSDCQESYKIVICGLRLPAEYDELKAWQHHHVLYKGFVKDIELYFKAADVFINPITDGGGIKTKLVEALAANTRCVSFENGAFGVPKSVTGDYLAIVENENCRAFAASILAQLQQPSGTTIPASFFDHFSWDAIAGRVVSKISIL